MTIKLVPFDGLPSANRFYGGNAGRKASVIWDGAPWMVKFPENTSGMRGNIRSYTTSPISEWLGSHVYQLLGVPVHKTVLGVMQGKVVVACRDFTSDGCRFADFHDIKNSYRPSDEVLPDGTASGGSSTFLSDVLEAVLGTPILAKTPGTYERFWDMFVIDALIGNADRNNNNWGLFVYDDGHARLAPVFDNGNAFFNKKRGEGMRNDLLDAGRMAGMALAGVTSVYRMDDGSRVRPFDYMALMSDPGCNAAVLRVAQRLSLESLLELIDALPAVACGCEIMSHDVAEFHKEILARRVTDGIFAIAHELGACPEAARQ